MTGVSLSVDTILQYAQKLTAEERAALIGQLAQTLVAPTEPSPPVDRMAILAGIWERLDTSGHQSPTPQDVAAYLEDERRSWNDEL